MSSSFQSWKGSENVTVGKSYSLNSLTRGFESGSKALHRLGLEDEGFFIHSLRHGGAARDYHHGFGTRDEFKARGRWESDKTFRKCFDRGRTRLSLDRLKGPKQQANLELVKQHHGGLFDLPMVIGRFEHL